MNYEDYVNNVINGDSPDTINTMVDMPTMPIVNVQPISDTNYLVDAYTPYDLEATQNMLGTPMFNEALNKQLNTPPPSPSIKSNNIYKIKRGDSLSKIAKMYGTSVETLASLNNIADINRINAGAKLILPNEAKLKNRYQPVSKTTAKVVNTNNKVNTNKNIKSTTIYYRKNEIDANTVKEQNNILKKQLGNRYKNVVKIDTKKTKNGQQFVYTFKDGSTQTLMYKPTNSTVKSTNSKVTTGKKVKVIKLQKPRILTGNPPLAMPGSALVAMGSKLIKLLDKGKTAKQVDNWITELRDWVNPRGTIVKSLPRSPKALPRTKTPLLPAPSNNSRIKYINAGTKGLKRASSSAKAATRNALLKP